jgi:hypothetical protein
LGGNGHGWFGVFTLTPLVRYLCSAQTITTPIQGNKGWTQMVRHQEALCQQLRQAQLQLL